MGEVRGVLLDAFRMLLISRGEFSKNGIPLELSGSARFPLKGLIFLCHLFSSPLFTRGRNMSFGGLSLFPPETWRVSLLDIISLRALRIKADLCCRQSVLQLHGEELVQLHIICLHTVCKNSLKILFFSLWCGLFLSFITGSEQCRCRTDDNPFRAAAAVLWHSISPDH